MTGPSRRANKMEPGEAMRELDMSGSLRWIGPWAGFVLCLAVGRLLTGESAVRIDELVFGMPLSWLVAWLAARGMKAGSVAAGALVAVVGLAIGLLA